VRARAACYGACGPKGDSSRIDCGGSSFQSKSQQRRRTTPDAVPVVRTLPLGVERQVRKSWVAAVHRVRVQRPVGDEGVGKREPLREDAVPAGVTGSKCRRARRFKSFVRLPSGKDRRVHQVIGCKTDAAAYRLAIATGADSTSLRTRCPVSIATWLSKEARIPLSLRKPILL
jgi:hypothetical protein